MKWKPPKIKRYTCTKCKKPTGILYGNKCEKCEFDNTLQRVMRDWIVPYVKKHAKKKLLH